MTGTGIELHTVPGGDNIMKLAPKQQLVFGWAYVAHKDGAQIVDKSGDVLNLEDIEHLEKAAYEFVLKSRMGGDFHQEVGVSTLVESIIFTPQKIEKMGLPVETPIGWWTGFHVHKAETWAKVESGLYTMFSIHGSGIRTKVEG